MQIHRMMVTVLGLGGLSACATPGTNAHGGASICRPAAAAALVGHRAPDDAVILRRTHSATMRRLAPGDMMTRDYREDRVTVTVAEGRVVSASCG